MLTDLGTPAKGLVRSAGMPPEVRRRRTILVLLILASFTLITLDARRSAGSPVDPVRDAAAAVFGPLESGASSARQPMNNLRDRFAEVDRLKADNDKLKAETAQQSWTGCSRSRRPTRSPPPGWSRSATRKASTTPSRSTPVRRTASGPT
jgi:hypothetical protein